MLTILSSHSKKCLRVSYCPTLEDMKSAATNNTGIVATDHFENQAQNLQQK